MAPQGAAGLPFPGWWSRFHYRGCVQMKATCSLFTGRFRIPL
jgi:hypothetical protein